MISQMVQALLCSKHLQASIGCQYAAPDGRVPTECAQAPSFRVIVSVSATAD